MKFFSLLNRLFPYSFYEIMCRMIDKIYSLWISNEFKSSLNGKKTYVSVKPKLTLIGGQYIQFGEGSSVGRNSVLTAWEKHGEQEFTPVVTIGNNVIIGDEAHITAINKIVIGNNVLIGKKVTITDNSHGKLSICDCAIHPSLRQVYSKGSVIIDDYVWLGDKSTILPGVHIGKGSIIGANSVVTKDISSNSIAVGAPAKVVQKL